MGSNHVFNHRRVRLRRTYIPRSENLSVALVFIVLLILIVWLRSTSNDFDPTERDLPVELLGDNSLAIEIYTRPLKPWIDPSLPITGSAFDLGPFPAPTLDDQWQPVGRVKRFQPDNLYEKINGEAEKFIKQGFVDLAYLRLRSTSGDGEIAIELFDQGDLGGSLGIFAEHVAGRTVEERDGVSFLLTEAGAIGRTDRYFFRIAGDRSGSDIVEKASDLVIAFAQLNRDSTTANKQNQDVPAGFALLNKRLGIAESDIHFQENNVFQYDFAQRFWFGNAGLGGDVRLFVHIADTVTAAEKLISALVEEHSHEYQELESDDPYTLFQHRYLNTYFVVAQRGPYVFGIENSPNIEPLTALLERISENLDDGES